ncbi:universal stress protein [Variovorax sp. OV329]|uniref:universal stress protein n=1 Tax=Variovorax sp. OV329 TaxID=1882825 RepID=UPI0008EBCAF6|nr:universal stress protein [Variovorax sp. OV329]SFM62765.1 Universal stress protein family protein [Variovorax sp. OV329]
MSYKTILVHLDTSHRCTARVGLAAAWARLHGAHLSGLLPSGLYDGRMPADAIAPGGAGFIRQSAHYLRERAERVGRAFHRQLDVPDGPPHELFVVDGAAADSLVLHGRSADLVVLGQYDSRDTGDMEPVDLPQRVLMDVGRPILLVPHAGQFRAVPRHALAAWDGSRESAVALHAALPALAHAQKVTLIHCRPARTAAEPGLQLTLPEVLTYLRRHGVPAEAEDAVGNRGVADTLLSHVADLDVDLLVMGGYGHSRLRELVLGGTTRSILRQMTVPVLMAH